MTDDLTPTPDVIPAPAWLTPAELESDPWRGVTVAPGTPFAEWAAYTGAMLRFARGLQWVIGDLLAQGEALYGEDFAQVLEAADYSDETIRACGWVARRIPPVRRRTDLSWSHHKEVAALDAPAADALLERAAAEGLSSREVRRLARPTPAGRPQAPDGPAPDFDAWLASYATPDGKEANPGGYRVALAPTSNLITLTAEQALRLSERLRRLAETGRDEE